MKNAMFGRYFLIGILTVLIDFGVLYLLSSFGVYKPIVNIISVLLSISFNFIFQNTWSFKAGSGNRTRKLKRYIVLTTFNYFVNIYVFYLFYKVISLDSYIYKIVPFVENIFPDGFISKMVISGMIMCWNFFLFKNWVFKVEKKRK
ncbi:MAG: GtrA family protein [Candidatus Dojkabacteria bacterium]